MKKSQTTKIVFFIIVLITSISSSSATFCQETNNWQIKGFLDTNHSIQLKKPNKFMCSRTRFRSEFNKHWDNSSVFVSINGTYNSLFNNVKFDLREAYFNYQSKNWGFKFGKQFIIWGVADGIRITDVVSPMDMSEFLTQDYDDIRMPVNSLKLFVFNNKIKFEAIIVPIFKGYILPTDTLNPWNIIPSNLLIPVEYNELSYRPELKLKNIEFGGRLSFTLPGIDFSLSSLYTWNKMPILEYEYTQNKITIIPKYYRMWFVGADFSKPLGQFVFRGELAFNIDKHFSYKPLCKESQNGFNTIHWLFGIDWYAPKEWMLSTQLSSENIFEYKDYISQKNNNTIATLNISKSLINSTLKLSNFTYYDISNKGWLSRFSSEYSLNDNINIALGFDWIGGNEGIFSLYKNNSQIWLKAKYNF